MRLLKRNTQTVQYRNWLTNQPVFDEDGYQTGEYESSYSDPIELICNISPANGSTQREIFGNISTYHKILVTDKIDCDIDEQTIFYIEKKYENEMVRNDYVVAGIAKSLNVLSIALRKVETGDTQ